MTLLLFSLLINVQTSISNCSFLNTFQEQEKVQADHNFFVVLYVLSFAYSCGG